MENVFGCVIQNREKMHSECQDFRGIKRVEYIIVFFRVGSTWINGKHIYKIEFHTQK